MTGRSGRGETVVCGMRMSVSATNRLQGVVRQERGGACEEPGPLAAGTPSALPLRQAIADARDFDRLRAAGRAPRTTAVALHDAGVPAARASATVSPLADSLTRRS